MKIKLLIIPDKVKQIILTPETDEEKSILKMFKEPNIEIYKSCDYEIDKCQGGYYREYPTEESVCVIIKEKEK